MASLYFDEAEIGQLRTAGPYLVSSEESLSLPESMIPSPSTQTRKLPHYPSSRG